MERLKVELADPEGFTSYKEVKIWLEALLDIKVKYDVVHYLVYDKLKDLEDSTHLCQIQTQLVSVIMDVRYRGLCGDDVPNRLTLKI